MWKSEGTDHGLLQCLDTEDSAFHWETSARPSVISQVVMEVGTSVSNYLIEEKFDWYVFLLIREL